MCKCPRVGADKGWSHDDVVDLSPVRALRKPVTLAAIKSDARFGDFALVRMGRLSVMPVPEALERGLLEMGEG